MNFVNAIVGQLFTLGVKAEIEKIFLISPKLRINAELYSLVLTPRLKKGYPSNLGSQFATLGANKKQKKMLKVGPPSVLGLDSYVKRALSCELPPWPEIPLKILLEWP